MPFRPQNRNRTANLNRWLWLLAFVLLLGPTAFAAPVLITLRNGDRITGEIKSENAERVVLKSAVAGTIRIPKAEISRREPLLPPTTSSPTAAPVASPAPPAPATKPAPAGVAAAPAPGSERALTATNAPAPTLGSTVGSWLPEWLAPYTTNWHGSVQLGMDLGFGTADQQTFYGNAYANHAYDRVRNNAEYHVAYGTLNGRESANRMNGRIKTDYDLGTKRRTYAYQTGGVGYDEIRRVDMEFDEGVGLGYKILQRPQFNLNGELGGQYQNINFLTAQDRSYLSFRVAESLTWQVSPKLQVAQRLTFLPNVEELSDYRVRLELSASYPLFKRVTLSFNAIELFDSAPPAGVDKNDLTVQSTIGLNF
jgi:hypothetical protein